jgi:hypothetical protein
MENQEQQKISSLQNNLLSKKQTKNIAVIPLSFHTEVEQLITEDHLPSSDTLEIYENFQIETVIYDTEPQNLEQQEVDRDLESQIVEQEVVEPQIIEQEEVKNDTPPEKIIKDFHCFDLTFLNSYDNENEIYSQDLHKEHNKYLDTNLIQKLILLNKKIPQNLDKKFDFFVVTNKDDYYQLQILARSIGKFCKNLPLGKIIVVVNDVSEGFHKDLNLRNIMETQRKYFGKYCGNVEFHFFDEIYDGTHKDGYIVQQILKLYAYMFCFSENILILDTKNFFIRDVILEELLFDDKLRSVYGHIDEFWYQNKIFTDKLFDLENDHSTLMIRTPFLVKRQTLIECHDYIHEKLKLSYDDIIGYGIENKTNEFILLQSFILKKYTKFDNYYFFTSENNNQGLTNSGIWVIDIKTWGEKNHYDLKNNKKIPRTVERVLTCNFRDGDNIFCSCIHHRAIKIMDNNLAEQVKMLWIKLGLCDYKEASTIINHIKKIFDLFIVTYEDDYPLVKILAKSIDKYCTNLSINNIVIFENSNIPTHKIKDIIPSFGNFSENVKIFNWNDYYYGHVTEDGYSRQQILKLMAHSFCDSENIIILDSKNFFITNVTDYDFIDGEKLVSFYNLDNHPDHTKLQKEYAFNLFNIDIENKNLPILTPFIVAQKTLEKLENKLLEDFNLRLDSFFENFQTSKSTEFYLMQAYIISEYGSLENYYCFTQNIHSLWTSMMCLFESEQSLEGVILQTRKKYLKMLGIHGKAIKLMKNKTYENMDIPLTQQVVNLWTKFGICDEEYATKVVNDIVNLAEM